MKPMTLPCALVATSAHAGAAPRASEDHLGYLLSNPNSARSPANTIVQMVRVESENASHMLVVTDPQLLMRGFLRRPPKPSMRSAGA